MYICDKKKGCKCCKWNVYRMKYRQIPYPNECKNQKWSKPQNIHNKSEKRNRDGVTD